LSRCSSRYSSGRSRASRPSRHSGKDDVVTLLIDAVVITISSGCLIAALLHGRAAVHDDWASIPAVTSSRRAARAGSLVGWISALEGIVLGAAALIPAVSNDSANRTARPITT
jgi:hypothetical protein